MFYWLRVFLYFSVLIPFVLLTKRGLKLAKTLRKVLFFNYLIGITIEGYFEYIIAGYLNLVRPLAYDHVYTGELFGTAIALYSAFLCLFLFPLIWLALLFAPHKRLQSKRFLEKYGGMFEHMRHGKKVYMFYYILYSLRRLIFCFMAFYASNY